MRFGYDPRHAAPKRAHSRARKVLAATGAGALLALSGTNGAFADNATTDLGQNGATTVATGVATEVNYYIQATGGACEAPQTVSITAPSAVVVKDATNATVTSVTINQCKAGADLHAVSIYFSSATAGVYSITHSVASGVTNHADFTLTITASNNAPGAPGAPTLDGSSTTPNNTGAFTVDWTAATDPDSGDTVTYSLEGRDADDADWSSIATGITGTSKSLTGVTDGSWKYRVRAVDNHGAVSSWAEDGSPIVKVDSVAPGAPALSIDGNPTPDYNDGSIDWFAALVSVTAADTGDPALADSSAGSGVDASSFDATPTVTEGVNNLSETVTDNAGNVSGAGTLNFGVDLTAPTVTLTCPAATVLVGSSLTANWSATDATGGSGVKAGYESGSVSVPTTPGPHTLSVPAEASQDNVGNKSAVSNSCSYSAHYAWTGFFQPIDNVADNTDGTTPGATAPGWNKAKAGSAIPVKFALGGDQGLGIFAAGYPVAKQVTCPSGTLVADTVEETAAGTISGLKYDAIAQQYNYTWKTATSLANTCQRLEVKLIDGTSHYAFFKFTK